MPSQGHSVQTGVAVLHNTFKVSWMVTPPKLVNYTVICVMHKNLISTSVHYMYHKSINVLRHAYSAHFNKISLYNNNNNDIDNSDDNKSNDYDCGNNNTANDIWWWY